MHTYTQIHNPTQTYPHTNNRAASRSMRETLTMMKAGISMVLFYEITTVAFKAHTAENTTSRKEIACIVFIQL